MDDPRDALQEARVIAVFIRHADAKGHINSKDDAFWRDLNLIIPHGNKLDVALYELNQRGTLWYEEIGEDGFAPIVMAGVTERSQSRLVELLESVDREVSSLRSDLTDILTFDPHQLTADLSGARRQIENVKKQASTNDLVKPLLVPLEQIERQLASVSTVASSYVDAYKNIIRPVQLEGKSGITATVRWAIISIVASTILSWVVSNWAAQRNASVPSGATAQPTASNAPRADSGGQAVQGPASRASEGNAKHREAR
jgi:hypothetical protein